MLLNGCTDFFLVLNAIQSSLYNAMYQVFSELCYKHFYKEMIGKRSFSFYSFIKFHVKNLGATT